MDLSAPLASFMNGLLDAVALRVVARAGTELTGRQVARLAGTGTPADVRLSLLRLVDIGLVISVPAPHATMFSANRSHILWSAVEVAMNAGRELNSRLAAFATASAPDAVTLDGRDEFVTGLRDGVQR